MPGAHHPPPRIRNDLYCVEWDVKLYCTILLGASNNEKAALNSVQLHEEF